MSNFSYIFIIIAVAYALQILLTGWQARRFFAKLKELRKDGLASVGLAGGKWSGRTYGVLVVNDDLKVIHANKLSGMTIFSQLKPVDVFVGLDVRDLLDEEREFPVKEKALKAFRNAAKEYFDENGELKTDPQEFQSLRYQ